MNPTDEYMTPPSAWEAIQKYIPKNKVIWEAFYGDGKSGDVLRTLGFKVIHDEVDFFENKSPLASSTVSTAFTEGLRDIMLSQTALELVANGGDLLFEGFISGYRISPLAIQAGSENAAQNRLTMSINVSHSYTKMDSLGFNNMLFSAFVDYNATDNFSAIEEELIKELNEKISKLEKKPIIKIKIKGDNLERDVIESKFTDLASKSLHFSWELSKEDDESSVLLNRPAQIDQELFKLAVNALKSEKLAHIAINELLPLLSTRQVDSATQVVIENFSNFLEEENDS